MSGAYRSYDVRPFGGPIIPEGLSEPVRLGYPGVMRPEHLMDVVFPARDQTIAKVVADLSEPDSGKSADNFVTNEDSFARVAGDLDRPGLREGVYLGVGPDQNFTYIAHAQPRLALILDFRRRNALVHLIHKALFALSPDRVSYLSGLLARTPRRLPANPSADQLVAGFEGLEVDRSRLDALIARVSDHLRPLQLVEEAEWAELATIQARLAGPGLNARFLALKMYPTLGRLIRAVDRNNQPAHFLARDDWYQAVRSLQIGDRLIPLVGDFAGPDALDRLGEWLRRRGLTISVFYASDVEFFLFRSGKWSVYLENLRRLPWHREALLIRTSTREINHPERVPGDSSTTISRPIAGFLEVGRAGKIRSVDELFESAQARPNLEGSSR